VKLENFINWARHRGRQLMVVFRTKKKSDYFPIQHLLWQWFKPLTSSGHYMYSTVVNICTASLTFSNSTFCPHSVFMNLFWIWDQTAIISLYSFNWLDCIQSFNPLKSSGHYMYRQINITTILRSAHTVYLWVWCCCQNKKRLFPHTTLTVWFV
jgi:hypothetical protein